MQLVFDHAHASITEAVCGSDPVADFIVLSGPNGSGKSQLLEAIENGAVRVDGQQPVVPNFVVRRFVTNQLVAVTDGAQSQGAYRDRWVDFENLVTSQLDALRREPAFRENPAAIEVQLCETIVVNHRQISRTGLAKLIKAAGKPLSEFEHSDFRRHTPLLSGIRDPFQFSISELFLTYHSRKDRNRYQRWIHQEDPREEDGLADAEFDARFGAPPWELLNDTLDRIGLDYQFVPPVGSEENLSYEVKLRHKDTGAEVTTALLSSGEKTLLVVAMTLYTGSRMGDSIELPKVLLLDEADASLHPSMVKSLLQVIEDVFVGTYGVRVIMTTHSPTTVALAPEEALYTMRRGPAPRLRKAATRDEALSSLTVGLSTLSVRIENRRMIFVESDDDESCYQELYRIVRPSLNADISLEFVASGKGKAGGSDTVKYLVGKLRENGKTNVFGLLDRDNRGGAGDGLVYNAERYAIENLVLDPLVLAAFLLREQVVSAVDLGLPDRTRHSDLRAEHAQALIDEMTKRVKNHDDDVTPVDVAYRGGFKANVPAFWLNTQGHALEARVVDTFKPLNRFSKGLKRDIITRGFGDLPDFIPMSAVDLLTEILDTT